MDELMPPGGFWASRPRWDWVTFCYFFSSKTGAWHTKRKKCPDLWLFCHLKSEPFVFVACDTKKCSKTRVCLKVKHQPRVWKMNWLSTTCFAGKQSPVYIHVMLELFSIRALWLTNKGATANGAARTFASKSSFAYLHYSVTIEHLFISVLN